MCSLVSITAATLWCSSAASADERDRWSLRPLQRTAASPQTSRCIDELVRESLARHGLRPSERAERSILIRRLSFDLTGLPPTPDDLARFLADDELSAYERLVERLLASAAFGEHWARMWLDLARYTDTTAVWLESTASAWIYRDWVVRAWSDDRPYDEFSKRQLAADLVPEAPVSDTAALGFLGLSPTYWKELRLAPEVIEKVVAEEWDERIDAVTRTFLGLTVACARCHDHKFDPISMQDYYALAGVFASSQIADRATVAPEIAERVRRARKQVAALEKSIRDAARKKDESTDERVRKWRREIETLRADTPHYFDAFAKGVREASIYVRADGPDKTRLEYKENTPRDVPVFQRGDPTQPAAVMPRRFLSALAANGDPVPFGQGSGRRELADAVFRDARPLAARVIVNRVWLRLFGEGIVRTPSNFGVQGERPTHPELLDELAARLVDRGWSLKWLIRSIVLSATYRQTSATERARLEIDPDNRWLWRMPRRRLDVEAWRDSLLAASGRLQRGVGGEAFDIDDHRAARRTLYGRIQRRELSQTLRLFDFPDPTSHSPRRSITSSPLQHLFVLNSAFFRAQAQAFAGRVLAGEGTLEDRVASAYRIAFARQPTDREVELASEFVTSFSNVTEVVGLAVGHATADTAACHPALLSELKERGLLEDTLLIWGGEFGRTPTSDTSEGGGGRDHNHYGFTMCKTVAWTSCTWTGLMAARNLLGLDHERLTYRYAGRDFRLTDEHGNIVRAVLA